jgi:molecular chaperone DnaK
VARKYAEAASQTMQPEDYSKYDAEQEKISLSERKRVTAMVGRQPIEVTREEFEEAISAKVAQAEMLCEATIDEARVSASGIRGVFLAGGSTRIPAVRDSVKRVFGQEPIATANVDEVVALGAALYSAYKGNRVALSTAQKAAVANMAVAERTSKCFGTIALAHDEARGQARLENTIIIAKNERIPCAVTKSFFTMRDGQSTVECTLTESTAAESDPRFVKVIWKGDLELPANRPAGQEIRISYAYDVNQMMKCKFVDVATGREKSVNMSVAGADAKAASEIDKFLVD